MTRKIWIAFILIAVLLSVTLPAGAVGVVSVFDDMEHGDPFGNGWFAFGGSVGGGGIGPNTLDLPPFDGGTYSLETGWGGGSPGFFGGFGRTFPTDLTQADTFSFWINPDLGESYTLEINLQEDDNGDGNITQPDDDEFQFNCIVSPTGPCAKSGGGWQKVAIPLSDFYDDGSFLWGGNGVLDAVPVSGGGNGQLINIVFAVIADTGTNGIEFRTDYWTFTQQTVDDFEAPLFSGTDADGLAIGFSTFNDPNSTVAYTATTAPPAPVPGAAAGNTVLQVDTNVNNNFGFAGIIHSFENEAGDAWEPQDWSAYTTFNFWLYGNNTGQILFIDILDNRNPGSTSDDAERYSIDLIDDFSGWQYFEIPFADLNRKEVGNGAPNDGLTLTEVHGWAFGVFNAGQSFANYIDDVRLTGTADLPDLLVTFDANEYEVTEGGNAFVNVKLTREIGLGTGDPALVSVDFATEPGTAVDGLDFTGVSGTLTFVPGGPLTQSFAVPTFDNPKHDGDKTVILRLSNPVDADLGFVRQAIVVIEDDDPLDPTLIEDFERGTFLWNADEGLALSTYATDTYENALVVDTVGSQVEFVIDGTLCKGGNGVIPVAVLTTESFDATTLDHTTVRLGNAYEIHEKGKDGEAVRHEEDYDGDGDIDLVFHFRADETGYNCASDTPMLFGRAIERDFAIGQDWSKGEALSFWFYGNDSGAEYNVLLKDNRAADPGPSGWNMVWSEEFNEAAGTPPNPDYWTYEIGDGAVNEIPGWGNQELQYYTSSTDNSATDGLGNLVITAREATGEQCYYGDCAYTSARLISKYKAEFAYGRIESRILVPAGEDGLWPAFWSLGTDIDEVGWPQTGEIDIMEYVSRLPNEIFGTIHGPGYSGGLSYGDIWDFGTPVSNDYHTFAIEWEPDLIKWYVDDILYHTAVPGDVAPNEWVFNDPVFLILNLAIGGNFGGELSPDLTFPQEMKVDYVRVYQGPDTAERFEATFVDNFSGWQQVVVPFADFVRSAVQPAGAPDDGLGLNDVWGYGFELPYGTSVPSSIMMDQVRLELIPPPTSIVVVNLNDLGEGSLRQAMIDIADGGTITFDPGLAAGTINLTSGPLVPNRNLTIDGVDAPGLAIDGGGVDRVLVIDAGTTVTVSNLTVQNGYGYQLAGGVLNNGSLTLDHVAVTNNVMTTDGGDFWQGGGGIYSGDSSTLNLIDSTVSGNNAGWSGGGVYAFFNAQVNITRSTISGNTTGDVGGGIRSLGNMTIINSTISGNISNGWHGGAMFATDGVVNILNSTITGNTAPGGTTGGLFVGTFTDASVTLTLQNTIMSDNGDFECFAGYFGGGAVTLTSLGHNVFTDGSCFPVGTDQVVVVAGLDSLSDNGGPTLTHALLAGSPSIDSADAGTCPAVDQRGVARPQGAGCDIGAFELESAP